MSNIKVKIIYSLQIHIALQAQGFQYMTEMKNPKNPHFNCWVYEETDEFLRAFDALLRKETSDGR